MPAASEIGTLTSADAFDRLANEWAQFEAVRANPLLCPPWFKAAAQSLEHGSLRIVSVREDGHLAAPPRWPRQGISAPDGSDSSAKPLYHLED
jgi:hypothetical protein